MPGDVFVDVEVADDVVRLRIDTANVVREFLDLLSEQAQDGETRAPAKPANRALYRELAPFRLVELSYVDETIGGVDGAFIHFPSGPIFAAGDEIPEDVVDATVNGPVDSLAPVYVHIVLAQPHGTDRLNQFTAALSAHMGKALMAVYRDREGHMASHAFPHPEDEHSRQLDAAAVKSVLEANMHLSKKRILERHKAESQGIDGRSWAQLSYNFTKYVVEFSSAADRDDFVDWSRTLCAWIYTGSCQWEDAGFPSVLRPAEPAPFPAGESLVVRLSPPSKALEGRPWRAFGGTSASDAKSFDDFVAERKHGALDEALACAREYWGYCTRTIAAAEAQAKQLQENHAKRPLKTES